MGLEQAHEVDRGPRGKVVEGYANWTTHPNNPKVGAAEPPVS